MGRGPRFLVTRNEPPRTPAPGDGESTDLSPRTRTRGGRREPRWSPPHRSAPCTPPFARRGGLHPHRVSPGRRDQPRARRAPAPDARHRPRHRRRARGGGVPRVTVRPPPSPTSEAGRNVAPEAAAAESVEPGPLAERGPPPSDSRSARPPGQETRTRTRRTVLGRPAPRPDPPPLSRPTRAPRAQVPDPTFPNPGPRRQPPSPFPSTPGLVHRTPRTSSQGHPSSESSRPCEDRPTPRRPAPPCSDGSLPKIPSP